MPRIVSLLLLGFVCLCGRIASAQDPVPEAVAEAEPAPEESPEADKESPAVLVEDAPDNASGFAVFARQLNPLPADPVPVQVLRGPGGGSMGYSSNPGDVPTHWAGVNEEGETVVVSPTRVYTDVAVQEPSKQGGYRASGREMTVDLLAREIDLEAQWTEWVETLRATDEKDRRRWQRQSMMKNPGGLMILATRLHQAGHEDKANQIAAFLFEEAGKKNVLLGGMSVIVDAHYNDLLADYNADGDAEAFVSGARDLLESRGKYWISASALREHLEDWEAALDMAPGDLPEGAESVLTPELRDLYVRLVGDPETLGMVQSIFQQGNWLLTPPSLIAHQVDMQSRRYAYAARSSNKKRPPEDGDDETEDAEEVEAPPRPDIASMRETLLELHGLGMDALPLFRFMLEDKRFVPPPEDEAGMRGMMFQQHRMRRHMGGRNTSPLAVPTQYRDIAKNALQRIKPGEVRWDMNSPETLAGELELFIDAHRDKSRVELARLYIDLSSSWSLPEEAMYTLLGSDEEEERQVVLAMAENLESGRVHTLMRVFMDFAGHRPEEAEPALRALRESLLSMEDANRMGGEQFVKRAVEQIDTLLKDPDAEDAETPDLAGALDAWIESGNPQSPSHLQTVMTAAGEVDDETLQRVFAEKIQSAPVGASHFLLRTFFGILRNGGPTQVRMGGMNHSDRMKYYLNPGADAFPAETPGMPGPGAATAMDILPDVWFPLLSPGDNIEDRMLAQALAANLLQGAGEAGYKMMWALRPDLSGDTYNHALALGREIIRDPEGDWIDDIPSSEDVSEERATEIATVLKEGDTDAVGDLLDALTISERLFLLESAAETMAEEEDASRFEGLVPRRLRLQLAYSETDDPVVEEMAADQAVTREDFLALARRAQTLAQEGKTGIITLQSGIFLDGMGVHHMESMLQSYQLPGKPGIQIQGSLGNEHFQAQYGLDEDIRLDPPKDDPEPKDEQEALLELFTGEAEDASDQLSAGIDAFFSSPVHPLASYGQIQIAYKAAPTPDEEETP